MHRNMKNYLILGSALVFVLVSGLPVIKERPKENVVEEKPPVGEVETLEYERYLREVVDALESDSEFRKKLDKAPEADIRTGKIAQELEYVSHHVRSKLDEIKRREIDRLRTLLKKEYELKNDIDREHMKIDSHLNSDNIHTFEIEDLKKLILKTTHDLVEADKKRRDEFKQYELQKEFEKQQVLHELDEEQRKKYESELKEKEEKHNKHEKLHHPGNKAQLEEVWEKQDHMEGLQFDPRQFFSIHDLDGNGYWDETELKALFVKELDKVYQEGLPEDDLRERAEEMERMREHVMTEWDTNKDGLISFGEFLEQTRKDEFEKDPGWDTVDNQPQFTHEEYLEFERKRQEEIQRLIAQGALPPHPNMPQGYYPHDVHPNQHPNAAQVNYHPNQQYQVQQPQQQPPHYQQQPQYQQQPHYQQQQQQYQQQQQQQYQQQQQQQYNHQQQQYNQQPQHNQQQQYQPQQHQVPVQQQQQQQYQQPPPQNNQPQNVPPPQYQQSGQATNNQNQPPQQAPVNQQQAPPVKPIPNPAQNVPPPAQPNPLPNQQAPAGNNQQAPAGSHPANVANNIPPPVKPIESNAIH